MLLVPILHLSVGDTVNCPSFLFCRCAGKFEATPQQFAAVIGQMTGLQELGLRGFELLPEDDPGTGMSTVMQAISHLPHLNSLTFCAVYCKDGKDANGDDQDSDHLMPIDHGAAEHLAAATQLTSLVLCDCGLQDDAVNTLAASLRGLRKLKLDCNPDITGRHMRVCRTLAYCGASTQDALPFYFDPFLQLTPCIATSCSLLYVLPVIECNV